MISESTPGTMSEHPRPKMDKKSGQGFFRREKDEGITEDGLALLVDSSLSKQLQKMATSFL
jgi:hypothetical protein